MFLLRRGLCHWWISRFIDSYLIDAKVEKEFFDKNKTFCFVSLKQKVTFAKHLFH